jgi:hypothetical protein
MAKVVEDEQAFAPADPVQIGQQGELFFGKANTT